MNQFRTYEEELQNLDNIKILNKSVSKYKKYVDKDELDQIKRIALFQAMKDFDSSKNVKFTTYLYWTARFMVLTHLTQEFSHKPTTTEINLDYFPSKHKSDINNLLDGLTKTEYNFIYNRYVDNMTYKELGALYKVSPEAARKRELKIRKKLKCLWS